MTQRGRRWRLRRIAIKLQTTLDKDCMEDHPTGESHTVKVSQGLGVVGFFERLVTKHCPTSWEAGSQGMIDLKINSFIAQAYSHF